jgi:hypothetical protein
MDDFKRYILSLFVDLQEESPGEFTRYYKIVQLIQTNFRQAKLPLTTEQIDDAINELIDDGFLEGMGTSYRLSAMGKIYWENHSLLEDVKTLTKEVKRAKGWAMLALVVSLAGLGLAIFGFLR